MLAVTTNAGLAGAFSKRVEVLDQELASARRSFNWAILGLVISVLPLMLHIFPGLSALLGVGDAASADFSTEQFLARRISLMAIILPFAWLTVFAGAMPGSSA